MKTKNLLKRLFVIVLCVLLAGCKSGGDKTPDKNTTDKNDGTSSVTDSADDTESTASDSYLPTPEPTVKRDEYVNIPETADTVYGYMNEEITVRRPSGKLKIVNAADFGVSTLNYDNTAQMQAALSYCAKNPGTKLVIGSGAYNFRSEAGLKLDGAKNVLIDGGGAELIFSNVNDDGAFFSVENCSRTTLSNLSIDWNWNSGRLADIVKIKAVGTNYIDFEYLEVEIAEAPYTFCNLNKCDPVTFAPGSEDDHDLYSMNFSSVQRVGKNIIRAKGGRLNRTVKVGETYIMRHYDYRTHGFSFGNSTDMTFEGLTVYSVPGISYSVNGCDHFQILNCNITLKKDSKRSVTSTADGLYMGNLGGYFRVEGCNFERMSDDAINIHTTNNRVSKVTGESTLEIMRFLEPTVGHKYIFKDENFADTGFEASVVSYEVLDGGGYSVTLNKKIPDTVKSNCIMMQTEKTSEHWVVRNNTFSQNRARGAMIGAGYGIFENNKIYRSQGAGIMVSVDVQNGWTEGNGVENVIIRNNELTDCNAGEWEGGTVTLRCNLFGENAATTVIKNIIFENNRFTNCFNYAFSISASDNITLKNNTFSDPDTRVNNSENRAVIKIFKSYGITVSDNIWNRSPYVKNPALISVEEPDRADLVNTSGNRVN